jgi:hypothetical protein
MKELLPYKCTMENQEREIRTHARAHTHTQAHGGGGLPVSTLVCLVRVYIGETVTVKHKNKLHGS